MVNGEGWLKKFRIVQDPGYGMGQEVVRVLKTMNDDGPSWLPAVQNGKYVSVAYNLPIRFGLATE